MSNIKNSSWLLSLSIFLSTVLGCYILGYFLLASKNANRFVTVKGLSERTVKADKAIWNIALSAVGNNLPELQISLDQQSEKTKQFLTKYKIQTNEMTKGNLKVTDKLAQTYGNEKQDTQARFTVQIQVIVNTPQVDAIIEASQHIDELLSSGVTLATQEYTYSGPRYLFTKLNDIKPEMIAESTKNARIAAEEFAKNSNSQVGKIKNATQGVIAILPVGVANTEESESVEKTLRVISSVDYYIQD